MKIKVCGMREPGNIADLESSGVDYIGFIFYEGSSRFVNPDLPISTDSLTPVGVFVEADAGYVKNMIKKWDLKVVQLHGHETPEYCIDIRKTGVVVVKAFSVDEDFDFHETDAYAGGVDYFLFDTKGKNYGGNGIPFDWNILARYQGDTPFWLSGGIHPGMVGQVKALDHPLLYALDLNSGFEEEPGRKNIEKIEKFLHEIRN